MEDLRLSGRFEHEFLEDRRRQLELWLNRICQHPILCASFPVQHFLTCELTEKNNKVHTLTPPPLNPFLHSLFRIGKPVNVRLKKMNYVNHSGYIVLH